MSRPRNFGKFLISILIFIGFFAFTLLNTTITKAQYSECTEFGTDPDKYLECTTFELLYPYTCYQTEQNESCQDGFFHNPFQTCLDEFTIESNPNVQGCSTSENEEFNCSTNTCDCLPGFYRDGPDCVPETGGQIECTEFGYSPSLTLECISTELINPFYCYQQFAGSTCNAGEYLSPSPTCVTEINIETSQTALDCKTSEFEEYDCLTDTCNCIPGYNRQGLDCVPDAVNAATCSVSGSSPNQVAECTSPNFTEPFYCYQKIGGQVCNEDRFFYGYPSCMRQGNIEQSTVLADCYEADNEVYNCTTNSCDCASGYYRVEGECQTDPAYVEISPETVQIDTNTDPLSLGTLNILTPDNISFILDERGLYIDATSTVDQNAIDIDGKICLGGVCRDTWPTGGGSSYWQDGVPAGSIYYDLGFVGIGGNDPQGNVDITGTLCLTGDCIDEWSDVSVAGGDECNASVFQGFTTSGPYDGDMGGYSGINNLCELEYPDSHVCSTEEIMRSIRCAVPEILAPSGNGWLSDGPDAASDDLSNDCNAWTNDTDNASGSVWYLGGATGGAGYDSPCDQTREFMCCYGTGGGAGPSPGTPDSDWEGSGTGVMYQSTLTDQIGIGTATPAGTMDVDGTLCISGDCISAWGDIPGQWSRNINDIYYDIGNVGINTATPAGNLDVDGTLCISGDCINGWSDITGAWSLSGSDIYYTTGFVGVGTDTPTGSFHIVGGTGESTAPVSYTKADGTPPDIANSDCFGTNTCITRGPRGEAYDYYDGIYLNSGTDTGYTPSIEWACGQCGSETTIYYPQLYDLYVNHGGLCNITSNTTIGAGAEFCMHTIYNDNRYNLEFDYLNDDGSFQYTRRDDAYQNPQVFTHAAYSNARDCVEDDVCLTSASSATYDIAYVFNSTIDWACGACGAETTAYYPVLRDLSGNWSGNGDTCWGGGLGNNIVGSTLCIQTYPSGKSYELLWTGWDSGSDPIGNGFSYTRTPQESNPAALNVEGGICLNDPGTGEDCIIEWPSAESLWTVTGDDIHTTGSALASDLAIQEGLCFGLGGGNCITEWSWTQETDFIRAKAGGIAGSTAGLINNPDTQVNFGFSSDTTAPYTTISGGQGNNANSTHTSVGGGYANTAGTNADYSRIGGGYSNEIQYSAYSIIVGGNDNFIDVSSDTAISILGGESNLIQDNALLGSSVNYATIVGGYDNTIQASDDTGAEDWGADGAYIGGGSTNKIQGGNHSIIGGGLNHTILRDNYSIIAGGNNNNIDGFVTGGYGVDGLSNVISGGQDNAISQSQYTTISGGVGNSIVTGSDSGTIGGGKYNTITYFDGVSNYNDDLIANTIAGGGANRIGPGQHYSAIGGGQGNIIQSLGATTYESNVIAGGSGNEISDSSYSTVLGGTGNSIQNAEYTLVFGEDVSTSSSYHVIFFDSVNSGSLCINKNTCNYPIEVGSNTSNGNGAYLSAGGGWTNGSSKTFKENFRKLDKQEILNKVLGLEIYKWSYIDDYASHIGPFAEDMYHTFDIGDSEKYLASMDIGGVCLVSVQALAESYEELEAEMNVQDEMLKELVEKYNNQQAEINKLNTELENLNNN